MLPQIEPLWFTDSHHVFTDKIICHMSVKLNARPFA
jgi:hypothetical protein